MERTYDIDNDETSCCAASATYVEGILCCKLCYEEVVPVAG